MGINRVRIAKNKAEFVKSLLESRGTTGPFSTYADVVMFAAAVGAKHQRRSPLTEISTTEPAPISLEIFISRGYELALKILAIAETQDPQIISPYTTTGETERIKIFEEYANGGLEILQDELRGAVDYTERILLLLNAERFQEDIPTSEFDLSRFL